VGLDYQLRKETRKNSNAHFAIITENYIFCVGMQITNKDKVRIALKHN